MSLNICDYEEDHFIIPLRELGTGKIHQVECLHDLGFFFTGYTPQYRIFFKDDWEIVREPEPGPAKEHARSWHALAAIGGALILGAMAGILLDLFVH